MRERLVFNWREKNEGERQPTERRADGGDEIRRESRGKMDEERMERIKEATTEAQSPLNPSLAMMVGCGVGTASDSTAPF